MRSIAHEASHWINEAQVKIYVAIEADTNESYFCSYQKNNHKLNPISIEGLVQLEELSDLLKKDGCYFAGTGWPKAAEKNPQFFSQALGSAEPIAIIAKTRLETGEDFLPEMQILFILKLLIIKNYDFRFFLALLLALIQGLTEFLPVSSSAHLLFPSLLFGAKDFGIVFDISVHAGTLAAVIYYFKKEVQGFLQAWNPWTKNRSAEDFSLGLNLLLQLYQLFWLDCLYPI